MQSQFEQYIEEVGSHLKSLTEEERARELEEIRQHLDSLVEAKRACGLSEKEAAAAALRSFDEERSVARELNHAGFRGRMRSLPEIVRVALFAWSIGLVITLVSTVIDRAVQGSGLTHSDTHLLRSPTLWLGLMSTAVLYAALGGRGLLREMRSTTTPWGAAVRWFTLRSLIVVPYGMFVSQQMLPYLQRVHAVVPPGLYVMQYLGLIPPAMIAFLVARAAPGKAYRGIVTAALLGAFVQSISLLQQSIGMPAAMLTNLGTSLVWFALNAALPTAGAIAGGKLRLRTAG